MVIFTVPSHWREEYEPSGGGTFYEDSPGSGTLCLNVLAFQSEADAAEQMARYPFPAGSYETLPAGFPVRHSVRNATERTEQLRAYKWEIAVPVSPSDLRVFVFRYIILAGQENDPRFAAELAFMHSSIWNAEFSSKPGVAGACLPM